MSVKSEFDADTNGVIIFEFILGLILGFFNVDWLTPLLISFAIGIFGTFAAFEQLEEDEEITGAVIALMVFGPGISILGWYIGY